jgi:hypothetical protein
MCRESSRSRDLPARLRTHYVFLAACHPFRRGRFPIYKWRPCTGHRHDPGAGNYLSVPDDGAHLRLTGRQAS